MGLYKISIIDADESIAYYGLFYAPDDKAIDYAIDSVVEECNLAGVRPRIELTKLSDDIVCEITIDAYENLIPNRVRVEEEEE